MDIMYFHVVPNLDALDEKLIKLLATQRLQQILGSASNTPGEAPLTVSKTLNGLRSQDTPLTTPTTSLQNKKSPKKGVKRKRDFGK